ncbi:MAG: glycosyltransferase [Bacteroidota bacterium]
MNNHFSVLFLPSWYPTSEYPTHGIFIRNHAKALSNYCNVIVLYVYSSDEILDVVLEHHSNQNFNEYIIAFPKSKIPVLKSFIHFIKYQYYYFRLCQLVKKHCSNIHYAQINVIYPVALFFYVIKLLLKIKSYTIFEQWTGYLKEDNSFNGFWRKMITKRMIKNARKVWCLCEYQKNAMLQHQLYGNYEILGNVINTNIFLPKEKTISSKKRFIHVSTLDDKQKNISSILKVFSEIEKEGHHFELIIVGGKDEYLLNAKKLAKDLNLKNVEFTGILPQETLPYYYQSSDALVMFSNYETFCVAVYEALSCGIYVITTPVADLDKIISDKFGTLVDIGNEQQLKNAILKVIHQQYKTYPDEAHQLVKNNFSEEVIGKKFYDYYCSLENQSNKL